MTGIRIYAEGGGDDKDGKARLRQGLHHFLGDIVNKIRAKRLRFDIVACGPRAEAFDDFRTALNEHQEAFCVLLVDSEGPAPQEVWTCLPLPHEWRALELPDEHCHLMVQAMEAWFVADTDALARFFGSGFRESTIPGAAHHNVEEIPKEEVFRALKRATQRTTKGEYHKGKHAAKLLEAVDPAMVRQRAPHCDRLFATLTAKMA